MNHIWKMCIYRLEKNIKCITKMAAPPTNSDTRLPNRIYWKFVTQICLSMRSFKLGGDTWKKEKLFIKSQYFTS